MAEEYNVVVCALPTHATHLLQPLDVKIFQQCKHFHQKAIDTAVGGFDFEYKLRTFLTHLPQIRRQSLTVWTILSGWRTSGLWPVNPLYAHDAWVKRKRGKGRGKRRVKSCTRDSKSCKAVAKISQGDCN